MQTSARLVCFLASGDACGRQSRGEQPDNMTTKKQTKTKMRKGMFAAAMAADPRNLQTANASQNRDRVTPKSVTHDYVRQLERHAEALAEALREVVHALPPRYESTIAIGMMALADWEASKQ